MSNITKQVSDKKDQKTIWFPAKKFGYGWGVPITWQGWAVLVSFLSVGLTPLMYLSVWYKGDTYCKNIIDKGINVSCNPHAETGVYIMSALFWLLAWVLLLVHVCTIKGEPTKWRWAGWSAHAKKS